MKANNETGYYVGLDIGTDSVGWAVTDTSYHILRKKGKSLWGIRLFDAANTAAERRVFRSNRRRIQRRHQRIQLLQQMFEEEIAKVDPKFFQRMNDSAYWAEDKQEQQIYSLFNDPSYSDVQYYRDYPTIYHLRSALLCEKKPFDIRLLYLAVHHLMKNRGHFLFAGEISNVTSFHATFDTFCSCLTDDLGIELVCQSEAEFENILKDKSLGKPAKCARLESLCGIDKSDKRLKEIIKLIVGREASLNLILGNEILSEPEHDKICFSKSNYEEVRAALEDEIQENAGIVDRLQALYNWVILSDILNNGEYEGHVYLSIAKVRSFEKHHNDLMRLKALIKKYDKKEYYKYFTAESKDNYCAYVGFYKKNGKKKTIKKCSQDDFYKSLKRLLDKMPEDDSETKKIRQEIEEGVFLPLQVSETVRCGAITGLSFESSVILYGSETECFK